MRYINLKKEARKDPFQTITSLSCGPNFILNRQSTFKSMIKDQGVTFWFRFWLTFCLYPGCRELKKIQEQYPNLRNRVNIQIHQGFLQGSDEEASNYCLDLAKKQTKYSSKKALAQKKDNDRSAIDILQECSEMAFVASICTLFYTWLIANATNTTQQSYWSTPDEYLDEKFKPGILEMYFIDRWEESLLGLLDMKTEKTPQWLKKLYRGITTTNDLYSIKISESQLKLLLVFLKSFQYQKKLQIEAGDESLSKKCNESGKLFEAFQGLGHKNDMINRKDENNQYAATKKLKRRQCAYCQNYEYIYAKLKKCKRCENENWVYPRCYCSDICLVEHWFKIHQDEHTKWSNSINAIQPLNKDLRRDKRNCQNLCGDLRINGNSCNMRFIELKKELDKKSPYETILQFGCGPNFVLNRWKSFEQMIKDQGLTFWFRFWLAFTYNPGCSNLKAVQNQWPELSNKVYMELHNRFLQGSIQDAIKYCSEIIDSMREIPPKKELVYKENPKPFLELLHECTTFAFGNALCVVFYKWLVAKDMDPKSQTYWTIPKKYLDRYYRPNTLEQHLAIQWNENLASLLGVNERRLHWLKRMIHGKKDTEVKREGPAAKENLSIFVDKIADVMKLNKHNCIMEIELIDEQPTKNKFTTEKKKNTSGNATSSEDNSANKEISSSTSNSKTKRRKCWYCEVYEGIQSKFKRCKRCAAENWPEPRYYCSDACQIEHWFKAHHNEHYKFIQTHNGSHYTYS